MSEAMEWDWWSYPYQLQFLALHGCGASDVDDDPAWIARLGEDGAAARERFFACGLIQPAPPEETIKNCSVDMLKQWCAEAGLSRVGRKKELAERVIAAGCENAFSWARRVVPYRLSAAGKWMVEQFLERCPWGASDDWFDPSDREMAASRRATQREAVVALRRISEAGIRFVEVLGTGKAGNDCAACLALRNVRIPARMATLPLPECDRAVCRCTVIAAS